MKNTGIETIYASAIAASLTAALWGQAMAQSLPIEFRVTPTDRNPSACQQFVPPCRACTPSRRLPTALRSDLRVASTAP